MNQIVSGVLALIVLGTLVVFGTIFADKLGDVTGLGSEAVAAAQNVTVELSKIASDWFPLLVLAIVILALLVGVVTALGFVQTRVGR